MPVYDVLILGRGIAGAVLAEACQRRGLKAHVFDQKLPNNASMAAAGMVNPVVFRRDILSWRAAQLLPVANAFYTEWQVRLGRRCWHPIPVVKIFPGPHEVQQWQRAMARPETATFIHDLRDIGLDRSPINAPHGYGTVTAGAWLDVPLLLNAQREELLRKDRLTESVVAVGDIHRTSNGVSIGDVHGRLLVRCTGAFNAMPGLIPAKGETLTVRIRDLHIAQVVHRGIFLLPLGDDLFRVGATFKWDDVWDGPMVEARAWLMERLSALIDAPVEILEQATGVRPTSQDRRPILGVTVQQEAVMNGLGSRGVLLAPWCAEHLLDHLYDGKDLDPEVDQARFN